MKFYWCKGRMDWVEAKPVAARAVHIISDDCEVVSQADGRPYTSKARYRAELKARGMIEMGNEKPLTEPKPYVPAPGVEDTIRRVAWEKGMDF